MKPWIRKEWRQIAWLVWLVALVVAVAISIRGNEWIEIGEPGFGGNDSGRATFAACTLLGAALGYLQFREERSRSTESYLVHRDGGHASAFRAKVLAAWLAGATWLAVGSSVFVARTWLLDPAAPVARWGSLGDTAWIALGFVPGHAFGVFSALVRAGAGMRLTAILSTAGGTIIAATFASRDVFGTGAASVSLYFATLTALTALGLALSARMFVAGDDRELPFAPRIGLPGAAILLVCAVPLIENVLSSYQHAVVLALEKRRPLILAGADRVPFLAKESDGGWRRVDPKGGELVGPALVGFKASVFDREATFTLVHAHWMTPLEWNEPSGDPTRLRVSRDPFLFAGSWQHVVRGDKGEWSAWLSSKSRRLDAYRRSETQVEHLELARPDAREFSERTVIVYGGGEKGGEGTLVDLDDGTAWRVRFESERPVLAPIALPDGDRIVGVLQLQSVHRARTGSWEPFGYSDVLAVVGERGTYVAVGDGFVPRIGDDASVAPSEFDARVEYRVRRIGGDRVSPVIAVLDGRNERELLRHDFAATTPVDACLVGATRMLGLARSPIVTAVGLALDRTRVRASRTELALHGARPLWFVHFALALLMLFDVHRRLAGAPRGVRIFWLATTLLVGLVAWATCRALEPARTELAPTTSPRATSEPRLVTA
ncbi:MAG: hypothetical protein HZA52_12710 [Planctomycetes bacterium]|nr:hypothetical protein [Planctomycetota bacterium]